MHGSFFYANAQLMTTSGPGPVALSELQPMAPLVHRLSAVRALMSWYSPTSCDPKQMSQFILQHSERLLPRPSPQDVGATGSIFTYLYHHHGGSSARSSARFGSPQGRLQLKGVMYHGSHQIPIAEEEQLAVRYTKRPARPVHVPSSTRSFSGRSGSLASAVTSVHHLNHPGVSTL